jgi:transposase InsO family protein
VIQAAEELAPVIGVRGACEATGASHSTLYRRRKPTPSADRTPRPAPPRALSEAERRRVLEVLHSERFCDLSPAEVVATLLDEGTYLCSIRTMYRLLEREGESRERRDQLRHPAHPVPEVLATGPNNAWSWDITKLLGPAKWTYYYLYVILDIFSRYVVGWMVTYRESAALAKRLIAETCAKQGIESGEAHGARRPGLVDDLQAGGPAARGPRGHEVPLEAPRLQRQPVLRGPVQDPEVPARIPPAVRIDRGRPFVLARGSSAGTTRSTAIGGSLS